MAARRMAAARVSPFAGARAELAATGVRRLSTAPAVRISPTRVALGLGAAAGVVGLGALGAHLQSNPALGKTLGLGGSAWSPLVQQRVAATMAAFGYTITATGLVAAGLWRAGAVSAIAAVNPWVVMGLGLASSVACVMAINSMDASNTAGNIAALTAFATANAVPLCVMGTLGAPILLRAGLYTGVVVGALSAVAASSPSDRFLSMGGPLAIGLGLVVVASLGSAIFPTTAVGGVLSAVSLYGGTGLFGAFVLYDTSRIIHTAKHTPSPTEVAAATGTATEQYHPYRQSIGIYLDSINLFIRIATLLAGSQGRRK